MSGITQIILAPQKKLGGQTEYITAGSFTWTCPEGVTSVCVVCIGGGGGGIAYLSGAYAMHGGTGGGLGWKNNIAVTPGVGYTVVVGGGGADHDYSTPGDTGGNSYFISLATVSGYGGYGGSYSLNRASGGTYIGDGGGNGGGTQQTSSSGYGPPGGGGAGGYSGNGGKGIDSGVASSIANGAGGGAAGGGNNDTNTGYGGGGTGIYGEGSPGVGDVDGAGAGGSLGTSGTTAGVPGQYGGGGGGSTAGSGTAGDGAAGAVRIIWGAGRSFPSTNTANV